jgi:tetratricopeptide (TPR) repeat protein
MDINSIISEILSNIKDINKIERIHNDLLKENRLDDIKILHENIFKGLSSADAEAVIKAIDMCGRKKENEDFVPFLTSQISQIYWKTLNDALKAEFQMRKLLENKDYAELTYNFYLEFYATRGNWLRLEEFITKRIEHVQHEPKEQKRILARIAEQYKNRDKSLSYWQALYTAAPDDEEAENALKRIYIETGKWTSLADLLNKKVKSLPDEKKEEKLALLFEIVDIFKNKLQSDLKVVSIFQTILQIDPGNQEALDALINFFETGKRWQDLVKVLQTKISFTGDKDQLLALHHQVAQLMVDKFSNVAEAIKSYEAMLEISADRLDVITTLKDLYERRRNFEKVIELSVREIDFIEDAQKKVQQLEAIALSSAEKVRKPAMMIDLWEKILVIDENHINSLINLETLYERSKRYDDLVRILIKRLSLAQINEEKVGILEKLAGIEATKRDNTDAAVDYLKKVLEINTENHSARKDLKNIYIQNKNWDGLEWFFKKYDTVEDFARTLDAQIKTIESVEEKVSLLFKIARIYRDELQQPAKAIKEFETIHMLDKENTQAARELIPLYKNFEDYKKLPPVFDIAVNGAEDAAERRDLLLDASGIYETKLGNVEKAFFYCLQAYKENPSNIPLRDEVERLAGLSKNWDTHVSVLEESLEHITSEKDKINTLMKIGEIYTVHLKTPDSALTAYDRIIKMKFDCVDALVKMEEIFREQKNFENLLSVLKSHLELIPDKRIKLGIRFEIGEVLRDRVKRLDEAEETYLQILTEFENNERVYDELGLIYLELENFSGMKEILSKQLSLQTAKKKPSRELIADIHYKLGKLNFALAGDLKDTVDHYVNALKYIKNFEPAVAGLESLLPEQSVRSDVLSILKICYEEGNNYQNLADILELQTEGTEDPAQKLNLLYSLSGIYRDSLQNRYRCLRTLMRIFSISPSSNEIWASLEELSRAESKVTELAELFYNNIENIADQTVKLELILKTAFFYSKDLNDVEISKNLYCRATDIEPLNETALDALEVIYSNLKEHGALIEIFRKKIQISLKNDQKIDYLFRIADILKDILKNPEGSVETMKEVLVLEPDHEIAYAYLEDLYESLEKYPELEEVLIERIRLSDLPEERMNLKLKLGDLREKILKTPESAVEVYESILNEFPKEPSAVKRLENLFSNEEVRPVIAPILLPVYLGNEDYPNLIEVYRVLFKTSEDKAEKIEILNRISEIYETKMDNAEEAFAFKADAFRIDSTSEPIFNDLVKISDIAVNYGTFVNLIESEIESEQEPANKIRLRSKVANYAIERSLDPEIAERNFLSILELDSANPDAIDSLILLYRNQKNFKSLARMLLLKEELVLEPYQKETLLCESAGIYEEQIKDDEKAIEIFIRAMDINPENLSILLALERLYEKKQDWEHLCETISKQSDLLESMEQRAAALTKKGMILYHKLDRPSSAIESLVDAHILKSSDLDILITLEELYEKTGESLSQIEMLKKIIALSDTENKFKLYLKIADIYKDRISDASSAINIYKDLLQKNIRAEEPAAKLEAIIRSSDEKDDAFEILQPVLESTQQWERLLLISEFMEENVDDPAKKLGLLLKMANIADEHLSAPVRSFDYLGRAISLEPENAMVFSEIEKVAEKFDLWDDAVAFYLQGVEKLGPCDTSIGLRLRAAQIMYGKLGKIEDAVDQYRAVLAEKQDHLEALKELDKILTERENYKELPEVIKSEIDLAISPAEKIDLYLRLTFIYENKLKDYTGAFESYRELLFLKPGDEQIIGYLRAIYEMGYHHVEICELLEPIYLDKHAWKDLDRLYEIRLDKAASDEDRLVWLEKLADINLNKLNSDEEALKYLGKAFVINPADDSILERISRIAEKISNWQALIQFILNGAMKTEDTDRKIFLWHRAASLYHFTLKQVEKAEDIYRWITDADSKNTEALKSLDDIYENSEKWDELLKILELEITASDYADDRLKFHFRAGRIMKIKTGDIEGAIRSFSSVLEIDEFHKESLAHLSDLYEEVENYEDLAAVLMKLINIEENVEDRLGLLKKLARMNEDNLGRKDDALMLYEEIVKIDPKNIHSFRELQRLHSEKENWIAFIDACEREIAITPEDKERRVILYKQMARAQEEFLGDNFQAQESWRRVIEESGIDKEALISLRRLYKETGDHEALALILLKMIDSGHFSGSDLLSIYEDLGEIKTEIIPEPTGAISAWSNAVRLKPDHIKALSNLERLYEQQGMYAECVDAIEKKADLNPNPEERASEILRAGDIVMDNIGNYNSAARLYEKVIGIMPSNIEAYVRLETIFQSTQEWDRLTDVSLKKVEFLTEIQDKVMTLHQVSRIFETQKDDLQSALLVLTRAVEIDPADNVSLEELWNIARKGKFYTEYINIIDQILDKLQESQQIDQLFRMGEVSSMELNNDDSAMKFFEALLEKNSSHEETLLLLSELYEKNQKFEKLIAILEKRQEIAADSFEKAQLLLKAAEISEKQNKLDKAAKFYLRVLEEDEANESAIISLERVFTVRKDWNGLLDVLSRKSNLHPEKWAEINTQIGNIYEDKLKNKEKAISHYEEMLNLEPSNREALARLEVLYGESNSWQQIITVYERLLNFVETDEDRIRLNKNQAILYEETLNEPLKSVECWIKILDIEPANSGAFENIERIYQAKEMWPELIDLLEQKFSTVTEPEGKSRILLKIGRIFEENMSDNMSAIETFYRILDINPKFVEAYDAMRRIYEKNEEWENLVDVIERQKENSDKSTQIPLLLQGADYSLTKIGNSDRAIKLLDEALEIDPATLKTYDMKEKILSDLEEYEKIIVMLLTKELYVSTDEEKARIQYSIGTIFRDKFNNTDKAIEHLEKALEYQPNMIDAVMSLSNLYINMERWEKASPLLELVARRKDISSNPKLESEIHFNLGYVAEKILEYDRSFKEYQIAKKIDPDMLKVSYGLARIYYKKGFYQLSKDNYVKILTSHEESLEIKDMEEIYLALGEICISLEQFNEAKDYLEKVLNYSPANVKAIQMIIDLSIKIGDFDRVLRYKNDLIKMKTDPFEKYALYLDLGDIYKDKLRMYTSAIESYNKAMEIDPKSKVTLLRLLNVYVEIENFESAIQILQKLGNIEDVPAKKAGHFMRVASIYREKFNNSEKAIEYFDRALEEDPSKLEAFRAIDEILTSRKDWVGQTNVYNTMIKRIEGQGMTELEFGLNYNLGEIYRTRLKDFDRAVEAYTSARKIHPDDIRTREILSQLFEVKFNRHDLAADELRAIFTGNPLKLENQKFLKKIFSLFTRTEDKDKAYCVSEILVTLDLADVNENKYYHDRHGAELKTFKGSLDDLKWENVLFDREMDMMLANLYQNIFLGIGNLLSVKKDIKDLGLKKKNELDLGEKLLFVNVYKNVKTFMNVVPHKIFVNEQGKGMKIELLSQPVLLIGTDMLAQKDEKELAFIIGKQMTCMHPSFILSAIKNIEEMTVLFYSAMKFAIPEFPITSGQELINTHVDLMQRKMPQAQKNQVISIMKQISSSKVQLNLAEWYSQIETTAMRTALLCSQDARIAIKFILDEIKTYKEPVKKKKLSNIISFAISEEYFNLRKDSGVGIDR